MSTITQTSDLLVVSDLETSLQQLLASWTVLSAGGLTIQEQPDFSLTVLPTLPEDQALLRRHVTDFQTGLGLSSGILNCFQVVTSIADLIGSVARSLATIAGRLDSGPAGDPSYSADLTTFRAVLAAVEAATTSTNPNDQAMVQTIQGVAAALALHYDAKTEDDVVRMDTDL